MATDIKQLPEAGDLVIATIKEVTGHGAYVSLDEYQELTAFLHVSEIATGWIRNMERYVRPKQKTVLKVIRVDKSRVEVDLSLKQVSREERKSKLIEVKKSEKASAFMHMIKTKTGMPNDKIMDLQDVILQKFDYLYDMFEAVAFKGIDSIKSLEISDETRAAIAEESKKIQIPSVEIRGVIELNINEPQGVETIKNVLSSAELDKNNTSIEISYIAAPRYRIIA
ncbi:MAG: translation initiation factor IF-2 subunit alpha, partial [Nitrososphaeraceae archaeon]